MPDANGANPKWYTTACEKLAEIEQNAEDYEDPEEGDKAPSPEIFVAIKNFFDVLKKEAKSGVQDPRMFVSPAGVIVVTFGDKAKGIDIRFSPEIFFLYKPSEKAKSEEGDRMSDAIQLVAKNFSA